MDDYRRLLLETSAEPAAPSAARIDRRPAGERRVAARALAPAGEGGRARHRAPGSGARPSWRPRLADPASYGNGAEIGALQKRLAELKARTEEAEHRWLEAAAEIEQVEG